VDSTPDPVTPAAYPKAGHALPADAAEPAKTCWRCAHAARPGLGNRYCGGVPEDGGAGCDLFDLPR